MIGRLSGSDRRALPASPVVRRRIMVTASASVIAFILLIPSSAERRLEYSDRMLAASRLVDRAITTVGEHVGRSSSGIDLERDPNGTGLIGPEHTGLTTTLGSLDAKRTTTNPDVAALLVHLLEEAGVSAGDTVAVGCSASFPGLMLASLAAIETVGAHPRTILSLGASSYGATDPDFNLLDVYHLLLEEEVLTVPPAAASLGGEHDIGSEFEDGLRSRLVEQVNDGGINLIFESALPANLSLRMRAYGLAHSGRSVAAFINIGGSFANLGTSTLALKLNPGLIGSVKAPPAAERGALFEMAERGIPVIHLLFVKGLADRYGLPWDPIPRPEPGSTALVDPRAPFGTRFWIISVGYLILLATLALYPVQDSPARQGNL
jgi:poly-gamma-glutamate system protein